MYISEGKRACWVFAMLRDLVVAVPELLPLIVVITASIFEVS